MAGEHKVKLEQIWMITEPPSPVPPHTDKGRRIFRVYVGRRKAPYWAVEESWGRRTLMRSPELRQLVRLKLDTGQRIIVDWIPPDTERTQNATP
jgi:hypothetical protein